MTQTTELSCKELVELVTDYLEGALSPDERARFGAHLGECRGCTAHVEQLRDTVRVAGTLAEESLSPAARDSLLAAFADWKQG